MTARTLQILGLFAVAAGSVACGGDDGGNGEPDAGISPSCMEATVHSDLEWIQENVFTPSCASFASCHMGSAAGAAGLNLEAGTAESSLVDVDSTIEPDYKLVAPGDADNSYLLMILGREPVPPGVTINRTMPLGNPLLCDEKIEAVARWVDQM